MAPNVSAGQGRIHKTPALEKLELKPGESRQVGDIEIAAARPNHYSAVHRALSAEVKADAGADYSGSNTGYEQLGRLP